MAPKNPNLYGGPNPGQSGGDPRGRTQNQSGYQQQRYENQQGPLAAQFANMTGRANEADWGNYNDIMGLYRGIASGAPGSAGSSTGGFGPSHIGYTDPFKSYAGYEEFSKTGGYSPQDIANMRSRGISPIRAAYSNAEREVGRQRSLQGGYSPNAVSTLAKMAREQGQGAADATQNVEAGLAEARNKGRLAGLGGMYGVEGQRLGADLDVARFNAQANMSAAASGQNAAQEAQANQLRALGGMTNLYGTNPGMSETFGNQAINTVGQGGQFGLGLYRNDIESQRLPGAWDQTMGRVNDVMDTANRGYNAVYPWMNGGDNGQNASMMNDPRSSGGGRPRNWWDY